MPTEKDVVSTVNTLSDKRTPRSPLSLALDEISTEWSPIEATDHLERTLNYKLPYASAITGKGTILTREKQVSASRSSDLYRHLLVSLLQTIFHQVPGSHYILETEVFNEGVKYTDTFSLILRYCLIQTSPLITHIKVTAQVQYHKNVNFVIKRSSTLASLDHL